MTNAGINNTPITNESREYEYITHACPFMPIASSHNSIKRKVKATIQCLITKIYHTGFSKIV
jgi:hypothetical protein